jgi:hypothetical protein
MLRTLLVAGVAHARLFTAPAPNVASPRTSMMVDNAAATLLQPPVLVDVPVPQRSASGTGTALGVALVAAGLVVVAGQQAVLFYSGKNRGTISGRSTGRDARVGKFVDGYKSRNANIQKQRNGFGSFVQKFQTVGGKSKYGVPIFLPNGNVNPAYLQAEREEIQAQSRLNTKKAEQKRKNLVKNNAFQLADYLRKQVGPVGYQASYDKGR